MRRALSGSECRFGSYPLRLARPLKVLIFMKTRFAENDLSVLFFHSSLFDFVCALLSLPESLQLSKFANHVETKKAESVFCFIAICIASCPNCQLNDCTSSYTKVES